MVYIILCHFVSDEVRRAREPVKVVGRRVGTSGCVLNCDASEVLVIAPADRAVHFNECKVHRVIENADDIVERDNISLAYGERSGDLLAVYAYNYAVVTDSILFLYASHVQNSKRCHQVTPFFYGH
jgi:hypothetical protein